MFEYSVNTRSILFCFVKLTPWFIVFQGVRIVRFGFLQFFFTYFYYTSRLNVIFLFFYVSVRNSEW